MAALILWIATTDFFNRRNFSIKEPAGATRAEPRRRPDRRVRLLPLDPEASDRMGAPPGGG